MQVRRRRRLGTRVASEQQAWEMENAHDRIMPEGGVDSIFTNQRLGSFAVVFAVKGLRRRCGCIESGLTRRRLLLRPK